MDTPARTRRASTRRSTQPQRRNRPLPWPHHQRDHRQGPSPHGSGVPGSAIVAVNTVTTPTCTGIVAERPMYFNALGTNSGSDVLGVSHLGTTFYLADVAVNGQAGGGHSSSLLPILNPPNR